MPPCMILRQVVSRNHEIPSITYSSLTKFQSILCLSIFPFDKTPVETCHHLTPGFDRL